MEITENKVFLLRHLSSILTRMETSHRIQIIVNPFQAIGLSLSPETSENQYFFDVFKDLKKDQWHEMGSCKSVFSETILSLMSVIDFLCYCHNWGNT